MIASFSSMQQQRRDGQLVTGMYVDFERGPAFAYFQKAVSVDRNGTLQSTSDAS